MGKKDFSRYDHERQRNREATWGSSRRGMQFVRRDLAENIKGARASFLEYQRRSKQLVKEMEESPHDRYLSRQAASTLRGMTGLLSNMFPRVIGKGKLYHQNVRVPVETRTIIARGIKKAANEILYADTRGTGNLDEAGKDLRVEYDQLMKYAKAVSDPDFAYDEKGRISLGGNPKGLDRRLDRERMFSRGQMFTLQELGHPAFVALTLLGFGGAIASFAFSKNMTGNVIGLSNSSFSFFGVALFVLGLVGAFLWRRK